MRQTVKLILYYFIYQLGCSSVISFIAYAGHAIRRYSESGTLRLPADGEVSLSVPAVILSLLLSNVLMGIHLVWKNYIDRQNWVRISGRLMISILPLTLGMMLWMNYLTEWFALPDLTADMFIQMKDHVLGVVSIALIAPIVEEMLFRGAIEGHLLRVWKNPSAAIFASALIFGIIHLNPAQIPYAFVLGLLLGWLYWRTRSLLPCILLHLINNGLSVILMIAAPESASSMNALFGKTTALALSVAGLLLTVITIWYIIRQTAGSTNAQAHKRKPEV